MTLPSENSQPSPGTILIVDDNNMVVQFTNALLKDAGYDTVVCDSGQKALELVKNEKIDLVLLDVVMPDSNGITVAGQIKALTIPQSFLPIILVTALTGEEDKISGLACADDYVQKPFSGNELIARIRSLLRIRALHRELAESKNRYQSLYEYSPHMYISIDSDCCITDCNRLFYRTFGLDKQTIIGQSLYSFLVAEDHETFKQFIISLTSAEEPVQQHFFHLIIPGIAASVLVDMKAVCIGEKKRSFFVVIGMEDVSQRVRLEEDQKIARRQLYRSANLASIGTLASGVAHEINNPLTAILGFSSALLDRLRTSGKIEKDELEQYLGIINAESIRCRDIVENLSRFARERDLLIKDMSLADCLSDALKLTKAKAGRSGMVIENRVVGDIRVKADANKLEQAIVYILSNCFDFCPDGSTVVISTEEQEHGKYASLMIRDNGPGIAADILPKVFDPFFTTKEVGRGTGMGLAMCHRIMEECNGMIDITSEVGKGTTVLLAIPKE